ncbi:LysR family transcriptional regulator [Rhodococcus sp. WS3]|uniref:LysR family transcriptional regulator n=1 Tax=Rhodococcus sp. WS3 TaxID=2486271 RepID=UPI001141943E|nr:LysR family transcriptional regulator [Rhodococcus sp. WS3]
MLDVSVRDLEYIAALEAERNFTRAAERVHIAQPAFSQAILRIERRVGVKLFDRTSRTVAPTPAGTLLATRARHILVDIADAIDATRRISAANPAVYVHVSEPSLTVPRRALSALRRSCPDHAINQTTLPHNQVRDRLVSGSLTLAIGEAIHGPGLQTRLLTNEPVIVVMSEDHPLAAFDAVDRAELVQYPIVSIDSALSRWNSFVESILVMTGVAPKWSRTTTFGAATGADLVDDSETVLICVESMGHQPPGRTWRPILPACVTEWYVTWRTDLGTRQIIDALAAEFPNS